MTELNSVAGSKVISAQVQSLRIPPGRSHKLLPPSQLCQYHFHAGCTPALLYYNAHFTGVQQEWQNGVRTLEKPHYFFILGVAKGVRKEKGKDTKGSALGCCCNWVKRKKTRKGLCSLIQSKCRKVFQRFPTSLLLITHQGQSCLHFIALCHSELG